MAVRIFIKRGVPEDKVADLTKLLNQLRSITLMQPGYISGQTLKRLDKPGECMVISTWRTIDDWNNWVNNEKRVTIQGKIDQMLGAKTEYAIYE